MPIDALKNLIKQLHNKTAYPHARIGFGSRVAGGTVLGMNVEIGRRCYVYGSALDDHAQIKDGCSVFHTRLEKFVAIYGTCQ
jgi:UDP-3-O-[3-hydroxymyristoyl] glucosamine N-acyltransferase